MDPLQNEGSQSPRGTRGDNWLEDAISHDPVLGRIMTQLRRESAGKRFERTWDVEVVAWSPEDLLRM